MPTSLRLPTLVLLIGSAFGLVDCKKNDEPDPVKPSARETWLTTPKWRLDSYAEEETTAAGVITTTTYPLANFDPCSLDDFDYYHADKSFVIDEGPLKCSTMYPGLIVSGTWAFAANETELIIDAGKLGSYSRYIRALTATTMLLAEPGPTYSNGTTVVRLRTFSAQ